MSSSFDKALKSLTPQDARQWQELKNVDWMSIQNAVTRLFQLRRYPDLTADLPTLNEKLSKLSHSEIGQFIGEFYQDQILKKCMIILRQEVVEERGAALLQKLSDIWTQFYTSILPTLQAIFAPVQLKCLSVRALTIISFRDIVLLKTDISVALQSAGESKDLPPQIRQMLLVLQSVHRTPPTDQFLQLQSLVRKVVRPYLCMVPRARGPSRNPGDLPHEDPPQRTSRAETVAVDLSDSPASQRRNSSAANLKRRHSIGHLKDVEISDPS